MDRKKKEVEPLVSIIIPVYNSKKYLKKCLDSILEQTYKNLEIILVDDGSTDESKKLVDDYEKSNHLIKAIHQKNSGLSSARNTGLKIATGNYIMFVDSDDHIEPDMIQDMLKAIEETDSDIAVCSFKETYPNGKVSHFNNEKYPEKVFTIESALRAMLKEEGFMVSATMKLFPKNYFKDITFPVGKVHEDVDVTYKLIMKAEKIVFLPNEFYIYQHHESSIINSFDDRKFDLISFTDQMCNDIDKKFPNLEYVTKERRIRARLSLLRQIPSNHPKKSELINYLKTNKSFITENPEATKSDKIALHLALMNPKLLQIAYKLFK